MALFDRGPEGKRIQVRKAVQEKALECAAEAFDIIVATMRSGEKDAVRVAAAKDVLKIAFGKDKTLEPELDAEGKPIVPMTPDEAERLVS